MKFEQRDFSILYNTYIKDGYSRCTDPWYMDKLYIFLLEYSEIRRDWPKVRKIQEDMALNKERKKLLHKKFPRIYGKKIGDKT